MSFLLRKSTSSFGAIHADFETAIAATGFGTFNILLICVTFPSMLAIMCDTASVSFVIPSGAECDLELTNMRKGLLISAIYFGMICSAMPWAYIADTSGRKPVIAYGLLVDATIVVISATSQHWMFLLLCRFLSGVCICGPFACVYTYLSETNSNKARHPIILVVGILLSMGQLTLPLVAMLVIPPTWQFYVFGYKYSTWHLYLFLCGVPGMIGGISFLFFPESPKYLMTQGRNDEAMASFRYIFKMNNGTTKPFPVRSLAQEKIVFKEKEDGVALSRANKARQQFIDVIFSRRYFWKAVMVFFIDFCVMMCQNTVRLWAPQIFKYADDLETHPELDQSLCGVFAIAKNQSKSIVIAPTNCKHDIKVSAYIPNLYNAVGSIAAYLIAIVLVNKIGVKLILNVCMGLTAFFALMLLFAPKAEFIYALLTLYLSLENIASSNVVAASTSLFPTQIRATIVSAALLVGRIGSMIGNAFFPILMDMGCIPPILWITLVSLAAFAACLFMKNPTGEVLE